MGKKYNIVVESEQMSFYSPNAYKKKTIQLLEYFLQRERERDRAVKMIPQTFFPKISFQTVTPGHQSMEFNYKQL